MRSIGWDIGTLGCKAAVFNEAGLLLGSASREYKVGIPHPNWAEQNAEKVWSLAQDALRKVVGVEQLARTLERR
jgi:xylulokinase